MNRSVIVTGGAGFIGSHTCKRLAQQGYHPVVLDNLVTGHRDNVRWGPFVEGDIRNKSLVSATLGIYKPETVIHFAGSAYVGESVLKPEKYYLNNVVGSLQLLECCVEAGVKNFIFSSSCATYGVPQRLPIDEKCKQFPTNPYGRTKLIVESALEDFSRAHDLHFVSLSVQPETN
ncbi:MAG: UDP-glucose 4-epimerase [Rhizobiaceae bacterium]|nr:UDP-glucose 4-epimerase [Rhizobiaceae bacterium]